MAITPQVPGDGARGMTAGDARTFSHFSAHNAATAEARPCDCRAYRDIFTLPRWNAQGFRVKSGEHAVIVPTLRRAFRRVKLADGREEKRQRTLRKRSALFCRCQVKQS